MSLSEPVTKKKRERPSGHSRKKIAKEKSQRELELFKKMPPLDSFFSSNVAVKKSSGNANETSKENGTEHFLKFGF